MLDNLHGAISFIVFGLNTLLWCSLIFVFTTVKILVPGAGGFASRAMVWIAESWIAGNSLNIKSARVIKWDVLGLEGLSSDRSYLVSANHQSWVDIVVLQHVFNRRIPFLRFFLKHTLFYVPLLGAAWWALDFPFMRRHSKAYLEKHPEKRGEDLATTRKACEKFRGLRISILNFLEGTRFTEAKHREQKSPYRHLLLPKAGGIAFVLDAMGEQFDSFLDVTIFYPGGAKSLWGLFSGRVREIVVRIERHQIPKEFLAGGYQENAAFRESLQTWLRDLWQKKDQLIDELQASTSPKSRL